MSDHKLVTPTPAGFTTHEVAHHFESAEQEYQAAKLGFWLFLATEIMLFGGIFAAYIFYFMNYQSDFQGAGATLNWKLGALNTLVLLTSSWTMAAAVRNAQLSQKKQMLINLGITLVCAGGFMVVKYIEYSGKLHDGVFFHIWEPVGHYAALQDLEFSQLFYRIYFTATGIHGVHVLVGMVLIAWLMLRGSKGHFHSGFYTPVDLVGLYWHVVDLIWIFLFPLLYLVP